MRNIPHDTRDGGRSVHTGTSARQEHSNIVTGIPQNISRLPKLTLPIFEGNLLTWQTFWDSFESAVHLNNVLTDVQKLNYLRAHLGGEASRAIAGSH